MTGTSPKLLNVFGISTVTEKELLDGHNLCPAKIEIFNMNGFEPCSSLSPHSFSVVFWLRSLFGFRLLCHYLSRDFMHGFFGTAGALMEKG